MYVYFRHCFVLELFFTFLENYVSIIYERAKGVNKKNKLLIKWMHRIS